MRGQTIIDLVLGYIFHFEVCTTDHIFGVMIPRFTQSERYLYRVLSELDQLGDIRRQQWGKRLLIKAKGYRRRQVEHDLGTNDVRVKLIRSFWDLGYPFTDYMDKLNGWRPDAAYSFEKGSHRVVGIEYQKSPLTERRWINKFSRIAPHVTNGDIVLFVVDTGVVHTQVYVRALAEKSTSRRFYFATKDDVDEADNLFTDPIWYHLDGNKDSIFREAG